MAVKSAGPPAQRAIENTAPKAMPSTKAWNASDSARAASPAPSARATAEATPPPMPPFAIIVISM
jgi:hypothetical protein